MDLPAVEVRKDHFRFKEIKGVAFFVIAIVNTIAASFAATTATTTFTVTVTFIITFILLREASLAIYFNLDYHYLTSC